MTTPDEFLQFAHNMGLGQVSRTTTSESSNIGLSVLKNLCRLIEQIHQLKHENDRLRAQLALVNHIELFSEHHPMLDEDKTIDSPTKDLLKLKQSSSRRTGKGNGSSHHLEESTSNLHLDHELMHNHSASSISTWQNWIKVRHALKFTLRRKGPSSISPTFSHPDRPIPTISVSIESEDEHHQQDQKRQKKKNKQTSHFSHCYETDQDDEILQAVRAHQHRRIDSHETTNSSSIERSELIAIDDDTTLSRKQSKIARYRRKLRSKFDTVKKQFSEPNSGLSPRLFPNPTGLAFDEIGSGANHASLTAQLAPALTKAYQEKMRQWQTMQKSQFLVNYRRQSMTPKSELSQDSRRASSITTNQQVSPVVNMSGSASNLESAQVLEDLSINEKTQSAENTIVSNTLSPILSPNQRSLILHQWREIMSEEIFLRHCQQFLQKQQLVVEELERNLKLLKRKIFSTTMDRHPGSRSHSMMQLDLNDSDSIPYFPARARSLESLNSVPASWILAVQSAAYSDILDGTTEKTTESSVRFHKEFFDQLQHFKDDRTRFQEDSIQHLQAIQRLICQQCHEEDANGFVLRRAHLQKSSTEVAQPFLPDPLTPSLITCNNLEITTDNLVKRSKRSRFDLRGSFQRGKTTCMSQFHLWMQRRRQQQNQEQSQAKKPRVQFSTEKRQRRKSATETKIGTPPTLFGSPRLARLHQRFFKSSMPDDSSDLPSTDISIRVYLPPFSSPISRHPTLLNNSASSSYQGQDHSNESIMTPINNRKCLPSSSRPITAKERRESFASMSNAYNHPPL